MPLCRGPVQDSDGAVLDLLSCEVGGDDGPAVSRCDGVGASAEVVEEMRRFEPTERLVTVGDTSHRCDGQRLVGITDLWAGHIRIDGLYVQVSTTAPTREIAVRICSNAPALTRTPPQQR